MRPIAALPLILLLASCAQKADLKPPKGANPLPTPYGATIPPDSRDLLAPVPQAAPERSVELRTRSEDREDDPFDLPPE